MSHYTESGGLLSARRCALRGVLPTVRRCEKNAGLDATVHKCGWFCMKWFLVFVVVVGDGAEEGVAHRSPLYKNLASLLQVLYE